MAQLMIEVLREGMRKRKFSIHAFVIMPDHLHVLLTPDHLLSMERAVQLIKGGFSFRVKKELGLAMEIWQPSFSNHRVRNEGDFSSHLQYILGNPERARLGANYPYMHPKPGAKALPV
jgi:putative transposase